MLGALGMPELAIIAVICVLIFGPKQLPKLAKGLGESIKELRGAGKQLREGLEGKDLDDK